jgi:hypothetical protein
MNLEPALIARRFAPHLFLLLLLATLQVLAMVNIIPPAEVLSSLLSHALQEGGLTLVAVASLLENLPGVNTYFPGSIVLLVRMTSTAGEPYQALLVYFCVLLPAIGGNLCSFYIGRIFPRRATGGTESRSATDSRKTIAFYVLTYWHPHLASLTAYASGSTGMGAGTHAKYFLPVCISWSMFWAFLLYHTGAILDMNSQLVWLSWVYLALWIIWDLRKLRRLERPRS